ncbi:hypothetical protein NQ176_g3848 [Zarea fungicola]|uniref:Uncharacterized protein n=1 Tax=Zarea fungicola TaxID=93591 RepID=A0ACC1NGG7_9HYPO|nr:hypothetical protein NQ176_g3848 [Lecanicillium fungicola]
MTVQSTSSLVVTSTPANGVRLISLNRPDKRNALSEPLIRSLLSELSAASSDPEVFSIILTGNGPFFCAGADLNDIAPLDEAGARACRYLEDLCNGFLSVTKPIIAAVNGPALGGGFELALMSDFIMSSDSAYFVLPETKIGLIPGAGGTQRLTAAALKCILLAQPMTPGEAKDAGLVCDVVSPEALIQSCLDIARTFTAENRQSIGFAKKAICRADALCRDDLFERDLYYTSFGTAEKKRGVDDFLAARRKRV